MAMQIKLIVVVVVVVVVDKPRGMLVENEKNL